MKSCFGTYATILTVSPGRRFPFRRGVCYINTQNLKKLGKSISLVTDELPVSHLDLLAVVWLEESIFNLVAVSRINENILRDFFNPAMISLKLCVILFVFALLWVYHDCYSWILYFWSRTGCTRSPVQFSWFRNCLEIDSFLYTVQIKNNFVIFFIIYYSYIKANKLQYKHNPIEKIGLIALI